MVSDILKIMLFYWEANVTKTVIAEKKLDSMSTSDINRMQRELMRLSNSHQPEKSNHYSAQENDDFI